TGLRVGTSGATTASLSLVPRSRTGLRPGGKKAQARMATDFLDWALADFSGYVAADELYDGPFCILSAVGDRRYTRLRYDVLDHDPSHDDIRADTVGEFKSAEMGVPHRPALKAKKRRKLTQARVLLEP